MYKIKVLEKYHCEYNILSPVKFVPISTALDTSLTKIIPAGSFSSPNLFNISSIIDFESESGTIVITRILPINLGVVFLPVW